MSNYKKLQAVLTEVFQLDQADLDFGIYRIMNQKRDAINDFLQNSLPTQVKELLAKNNTGDNGKIQADLDATIKQLKELSVDIDTNVKVKELRSKLEATVSIDALEQEVFSHLANFFKRYYEGGDFISLRRYKKDVYAIPYEGEEVKLHWANHDQYYIKTSEYLKNYAFKLGGDKLVKFQLKEASTEQNNNKTQNDQERRFAIFEELPVEVDGNTLLINFTYEPHKKSIKQDELTKKAVEAIKANVPVDFADVFALAPTESNKQRTLLDKHLYSFVARHTFDYFIHKDLGGFLRRELDFYIKNEVLYIDDINTENEIAFNSQISKIKALKQVANKIILFLEQLENFQKKLWLKKKFVIASNYCITLDRIPEEYYPEILENKSQLAEWKSLFNIDINSVEQLMFEQTLVIDTKFLSLDLKDRLLSEFENIDEQTNGLLINSENFQALSLLQERFKEEVKSVYIDPPFNLEHSGEFIYKTDFLNSSWVQLLIDRLELSKNLMTNDALMNLRSDYHGDYFMRSCLNTVFGIENFRNQCSINRIFKNKNNSDVKSLSFSFDSLALYSKTNDFTFVNPVVKLKQEREAFWRHMNDSEGQGPPKVFFGISLESPQGKHWKYSQENIDLKISIKELRLDCKDCGYIHYEGAISSCPSCNGLNLNPKYLVKATDEKVLGTNWLDISGYSNTTGFSTENAEVLLQRVIEISSNKGEYILDYFLGSGTTVSVAHKLGRKWIGIEMGEYFEEYPLTRMKKVLQGSHNGISKDVNWKGGGMFKYIVLENYEDTLNNLILNTSPEQQTTLELNNKVKEEYLIQYMLDVESREHLFDLECFKNPFSYQLKVTENNELIPTTVDLVETFNYLIGLKINKVEKIRDFKIINGVNPKNQKVLIVWRNLEKTNNEDLNRFVEKLDIKVLDGEFDIIYVNGDNNLANLKKDEETWKIRLIEEEFFNKMFENI